MYVYVYVCSHLVWDDSRDNNLVTDMYVKPYTAIGYKTWALTTCMYVYMYAASLKTIHFNKVHFNKDHIKRQTDRQTLTICLCIHILMKASYMEQHLKEEDKGTQ